MSNPRLLRKHVAEPEEQHEGGVVGERPLGQHTQCARATDETTKPHRSQSSNIKIVARLSKERTIEDLK